MKVVLILIVASSLYAEFYESIHSSVSAYYEDKTYKNSKQKTDAIAYGISGDLHYKNSEYKFAYEYAHADTIQPPLPEDLKVKKLFLQYAYDFENGYTVHGNYINILDDNLAITDGGKTYGVGVEYKFNRKISVDLTQYKTFYDAFDVAQSDLKLTYKTRFNDIRVKLNSITKYMDIEDNVANSFTKYAKDSYLTTGVKFNAQYKGFVAAFGTYFGKRAFGVMDDGFKIQHHAMEFDRTYAIGLGKKFQNFALRVQYIDAEALEMPSQTKNVKVQTLRFAGSYTF